VEYSVGKAKRAAAKVSCLLDGPNGIPVNIGIVLYKSLVRPHIEYAVPAWASVSEKDRTKIDEVQVQCLKKFMEIKSNSSSAAVEVIGNVMPMRIRIRQLCCREYARIMTKKKDHMLRTLLRNSVRNGLEFCPLRIHSCDEQTT